MTDNPIIRLDQLNRCMEKGVLPIAEDVASMKESVVMSSNAALKVTPDGKVKVVITKEIEEA